MPAAVFLQKEYISKVLCKLITEYVYGIIEVSYIVTLLSNNKWLLLILKEYNKNRVINNEMEQRG